MKATVAAIILLLFSIPAAAAEQPTAEELLQRAKIHRPITTDEPAVTDTVPGSALRSCGTGFSRVAFLFEYTEFDRSRPRYGGYVGNGLWFHRGDNIAYWVRVFHAGLASKLDHVVHVGAGIEYAHADVVVNWAGTTGRASASVWGPHLWIEAGAPLGIALRAQYGPGGLGVTAQYRYY